MGWWLNLADRPIQAVQLLEGDPVQIAVWLSDKRVHFYAAQTGALYESRDITVPATMDLREQSWQTFLERLNAPNRAFIPLFNTNELQIHTSYDGRLRLYARNNSQLILDLNQRHIALKLHGAAELIALGMDRDFGSLAALTDDGYLHIFQQQVYVGAFGIENEWADELPFKVLLPDSAGVIVLVGETRIQVWDMAGQVLHRYQAPAPLGTATCSPDGERIITGDRDQAMIRVYDAPLTPLRQHSASDLLAQTTPIQLLSASPPADASLGALAVLNDDTLVFALHGALCQTSLNALNELPQPRSLL
ncbi:MAG: hypothetical protein JXA10_14735 [Anaerolineae bacterium]|nr:hypothetical protein [Anaerolineae bacterium]